MPEVSPVESLDVKFNTFVPERKGQMLIDRKYKNCPGQRPFSGPELRSRKYLSRLEWGEEALKYAIFLANNKKANFLSSSAQDKSFDTCGVFSFPYLLRNLRPNSV